MAFTNIALVKKHIIENHLGGDLIKDLSFQLSGDEFLKLPHANLKSGSEKVKGKESFSPTREKINFESDNTAYLSHSELIRDSVVVASDSSLGQIYTENVDYSVDFIRGRISRIESGAIPDGKSVVVWYFFYRVYQRDADYKINYTKGEVKRAGSGVIEDGQWVILDYQIEFGSLGDEVVENAIGEANERVLKFIDTTYHNSADQGLVTAETYLVVSIVCNVKSNQAQSGILLSGNQANFLSNAWERLSDSYRKQAFLILSDFAKKIGGFTSPQGVRSKN
ncbi:MAG: hypothetical protein AMJ90_05005 [candidate division Zixibacteria bacterium SM23_73_2]|nr:MAG: hypothetical protein AMJ90_05005 [candidate division Zixibacteria bacterium SM23_73_2]